MSDLVGAKSWDAAEIAHELASPLTAMTLHLESLQMQLRCCEHCEQYVSATIQPALSQLQAANQFLHNYLWLETQSSRPCNVQLLIGSVVSLVQPVADSAKVKIVYSRRQALWWPTPPYPLRQVVLNLLNNALQAYTNRSQLQPRKIILAASFKRKQLHVTLQDFAGGFASNGQIWGHGIGLKNVRRFVETAHGSLQIHSQQGVGTTVYLTFPRG